MRLVARIEPTHWQPFVTNLPLLYMYFLVASCNELARQKKSVSPQGRGLACWLGWPSFTSDPLSLHSHVGLARAWRQSCQSPDPVTR